MRDKEIMYLNDIKKYQDLKEKSGIYYLYYDNEIIYIGQSKDIYDRLCHHRNWNSSLKKAQQNRDGGHLVELYQFIGEHLDFIEFGIFRFTHSLEENNYWEEHFIKTYKPKYNYAGVDIAYIPVKEKKFQFIFR